MRTYNANKPTGGAQPLQPLVRRYMEQRLFACLSGLPAAIAVFLLAYAFGAPWSICAAVGGSIEALAVFYCGLALFRTFEGVQVGTAVANLKVVEQDYIGICDVPALGASRYIVYLTSSRTDVKGVITLVVSNAHDALPSVKIKASRGDLSIVSLSRGELVVKLEPGWRRLLRPGDFEPIRIHFSAAPPSVTFRFQLRIDSKLSRKEDVENISIIAKQ